MVLGFGSFLCSVEAGNSKVALKVSMAVRSAVFGLSLSDLGSLARRTLVGEMLYETSGACVCWEVSCFCHVYVFVSQSGGSCFRSLSE